MECPKCKGDKFEEEGNLIKCINCGKKYYVAKVLQPIQSIYKNREIYLRPEVFGIAIEMEQKLSKKDDEKGDSWKEMSIEELQVLLDKETQEYNEADNDYAKAKKMIDRLNIAMMMFWRHLDKANPFRK